jgi:RNA polymerase sigma-70 factor, ECF subfamily
VIDRRTSGHSGVVAPVEPAIEYSDESLGEGERLTADPARLRALVDTHFDFVWRSLRRLGLQAPDADDAAQRVFWVAARKLDKIEVGRERAFLFGTACHVARDARRATHRRKEDLSDGIDVEDGAASVEELVDRGKARVALDRALDSMPMDVRAAFVLFELEEMSVPAIALFLGVPVGTVASRLRRGRELFQAAAARFRAREAFHGGDP